MNPFLDIPWSADEALVERAVEGDREALDQLLRRHRSMIYNLALRMLQVPADAEDVTQEVLVRITTRLSMFRREAAFRTWAYRIAVRAMLDWRRSRAEDAVHGFGCFSDYLDRAGEASSPENAALVEEAKLACMMGMLLCLDREQRIVFVLGEIFDVSDTVGSELLEVSADAYRKRLERARRDLGSFMNERCGLVDRRNPCRCQAKTRAFVRDGIVDPNRLVFHDAKVARVREIVRAKAGDGLSLFREHPFYDGPAAS